MELITQYLPMVNDVVMGLGYVCLLATFFARTVTPNSTKDDEIVGKVYYYYSKLIHFLPTVGINPNTQKLIEALEEEKKKHVPKP